MHPAQKKAAEIVRHILRKLAIKAGQKERAVAEFIENQLKSFNAKPSFETIVGSGLRSVDPHARPTGKIIRKGEQVVVDFGALYKSYCSDVTRTFFAGKPTKRQKEIFRIVAAAQKKAIKAVKAGVLCCEIDRIAREYINKHCPGDCFIHSTGHAIGRRVHQNPRISLKSHCRLKAGQVVTIEPGIYVKGWGGIRIEDMVQVTRKGCKILTRE